MAIRSKNTHSEKPKRARKRKARTEVSSSSSSSSVSDTDSSKDEQERSQQVTKAHKKKAKTAKIEDIRDATPDKASDVSLANAAQKLDVAKSEEAFTSFYLRQITSEFAADLDKIRSAGDFNNRSIGMLVDALKQGSSCFSQDEILMLASPI